MGSLMHGLCVASLGGSWTSPGCQPRVVDRHGSPVAFVSTRTYGSPPPDLRPLLRVAPPPWSSRWAKGGLLELAFPLPHPGISAVSMSPEAPA